MCYMSTARRVVHGSGIATQSDTSREIDHSIIVQTIQLLLVLALKSFSSRSTYPAYMDIQRLVSAQRLPRHSTAAKIPVLAFTKCRTMHAIK